MPGETRDTQSDQPPLPLMRCDHPKLRAQSGRHYRPAQGLERLTYLSARRILIDERRDLVLPVFTAHKHYSAVFGTNRRAGLESRLPASCSRKASRPRRIRDFTVPSDTPNTSAICS